MKDETFLFISDSKEKKSVARSACKKVTHGGAVRLPSDYMTKKELNAMNGEIETYRMNDPLTWAEFKKLPDDIKVLYIKALVQRYDVPIANMAEMFGVHHTNLRNLLKEIGCKLPRRGKHEWDKEGFYAWAHCLPVQKENAPEKPEEKPTGAKTVTVHLPTAPVRGGVYFTGRADEALASAMKILGEAEAHISVTWELLPAEGCGGSGNG